MQHQPKEAPVAPFGKDVTGAMLTMERAAELAKRWRSKAAHLSQTAWVMHRDDGAPKAVVVFADAPPLIRAELLWAGDYAAGRLDVQLFIVFDDDTRIAPDQTEIIDPRGYYVGELGLTVDTSKLVTRKVS